MKMGIIHQENLVLLPISYHVLENPKGLCICHRIWKYLKHKLEELNEGINKSILTVRDFNICLRNRSNK